MYVSGEMQKLFCISPNSIINLPILKYLFITYQQVVKSWCHPCVIKRVCQVLYFLMKTIRTIQNVLSLEALGRPVHAFVTAPVDYCNYILIDIQDAAIQKLQLLQNSAVRLVRQRQTDMHISPLYLRPCIGF